MMPDPIDGLFAPVKVLGAGAMGEAVLARDRQGTPVVVKLLKKAHASAPDFLERFRREIRALEKVRHPHIVSLIGHGFCAARGQPYYVMEFASGVPLDAVLKNAPPFSIARSLAIADQVLDALVFAHEAGIVHRDLKPGNLVLERAGTLDESARILDFGLAKHLVGGTQTVEPLTGPGQMLGTPRYMAPEQFLGEPPVPRTDIYAVGCILMELLTGLPPFPEERLRVLIGQQLKETPPRLDARRNAPKELVVALEECLAKYPDVRPTAADLRRRLAAIRGRLRATTARFAAPPPVAEPVAAMTIDLPQASVAAPADARRMMLDVVHAGGHERIFFFAGEHLRFGRGSEKGAARSCDLVLRSFPRAGEPPDAAAGRSLEVSRWHGTFSVTETGLGVRDEGSTSGTRLDAALLPPRTLAALPPAFTLGVGTGVTLRGRLLRARNAIPHELTVVDDFPDNPLSGLLLERPRDACLHRYVMVLGEIVLGSSDDDDLALPFPGIVRGEARIAVAAGRFAIALGQSAHGGRPLSVSAYKLLEPGDRVRLGSAELRFSTVSEDDMKPR
jgi:hypothetical protein